MPGEAEVPDLLTTEEIAHYLKLRRETVRRKAKAGEIPAIRIGGRFRFDKGRIDEWLHDNSTPNSNRLVVDDWQASIDLLAEASRDSGYGVTV